MSWATYEPLNTQGPRPEPMQSSRPDMIAQTPQQFAGQPSNAPPPPPRAISLPAPAPPAKSILPDISEFEEIKDWVYLAIAVLFVDVFIIFLTRYFPEFFGKSLNVWYNRFKLSAVLSDVTVVLLAFTVARYIYTEWIYPTQDWNPTYFTLTAVAVQLVHDVLFYFGIVKPMPAGHNSMIDVMKEYGETKGLGVIAGDSALIIGSSVTAMVLKAAPAHLTVVVGFLTLYALPYILETKNEYSGIS